MWTNVRKLFEFWQTNIMPLFNSIVNLHMYVGSIFMYLIDGGELCSLPKFKPPNCRKCENFSQERCDSGWCIDKTKFNDGVADCLDLSDEEFGKSCYFQNIFSLSMISLLQE